MAQDTVKADKILQEYYLPVVRELINQRSILLFGYSPSELENGSGTMNAAKGETMDYRGISRDAEAVQFAGREWVLAVHTGRNESGTMRGENEVLPNAGEQVWFNLIDKVRQAYKQIQLSGFSMELTERSVGAYVRLLEAETEGAINDLRKDLNRQAFGNQRGTLAATTADGANTFTVDNLQYLRVGMFIDLVNSSTDAVLASNRKITAINTSTRVVTYDGADVAVVAGTHVPVVTGNWKKEINGLTNIIRSDTFPTLHGIDGSVAGQEWNLAKQTNGGSAVFDEDLGQLLLDNIGVEGKETELIVTTRGIRRRYVNTLKAGKRFNDSMAGMLHGGFKYIDFNGLPLVHEDDAPKGNAWFIRPSDFLWVWLGGNDFRWLRRDGNVLRKVESPDIDAWKATLYRYCDLGCPGRKYQGVMHTLADDIP